MCICYLVETGHLSGACSLVVGYADKKQPRPKSGAKSRQWFCSPRKDNPFLKSWPSCSPWLVLQMYRYLALMFIMTCVTDVPVPASPHVHHDLCFRCTGTWPSCSPWLVLQMYRYLALMFILTCVTDVPVPGPHVHLDLCFRCTGTWPSCSPWLVFQMYRYRLAILVVNAEGPHCLCSAKWKTSGMWNNHVNSTHFRHHDTFAD